MLYCGDEVPRGTRLVSLPYTFIIRRATMVGHSPNLLSRAFLIGQAPTTLIHPATWRPCTGWRLPRRDVNITNSRRTLGAATSARSDVLPIPICQIGTFYRRWFLVLWQNVRWYVVRVATINVPEQQSKEGKKNHLHVHVVRCTFRVSRWFYFGCFWFWSDMLFSILTLAQWNFQLFPTSIMR